MKKLLLLITLSLFSLTTVANTVKLIVPFAQGGISDQMARLIQRHLEQDVNLNVIVEYRPGASGEIGTAAVANSDSKELVLLVNGPGIITTSLLKDKLSYNENNLVPMVNLGYVPFVLIVSKKSKFESFKDLQKLDADRNVTYGSSGPATAIHLAGINLQTQINKHWTHVPYKGQGQALPDLIGGNIDAMVIHWPVVAQLVATGQITALAIESNHRMTQFPNIPTFKEFGISNVGKYGYLVLMSNTTSQTALQKQVQQSVLKMLDSNAYKELGWIKDKNSVLPSDFLQVEKQKFQPIIPLIDTR